MKTPSRNKIRQSSLRTRELLIDAARQLFARFGVEKTTMNDIAEASKRGRRTVYMYFNSKSDVFYAVVGRELDLLCKRLEAVAEFCTRKIDEPHLHPHGYHLASGHAQRLSQGSVLQRYRPCGAGSL